MMADQKVLQIKNLTEIVVGVFTIIGTLYAVARSRIRGYYETIVLIHNNKEEIKEMSQLLSKVDEVSEKQDAMNQRIDSMADDMERIKVIQKALAEAQNQDRDIDVGKVSKAHWGERPSADDFTRGGEED